ncbi:MAG: DEAD/DEAH box helicase, partial [Methanoregula sp.]
VLPELVAHRLVQKKGTKIELSPLARVMSEHFIGIERLLEIIRLAQKMDDPLDIIAELEGEAMEKETAKKEKGGNPQGKKGHGRR